MNNNINLEIVKKYLNVEEDFKEDDVLIQACIDAAIDYAVEYTGLDREKIISKDSIMTAIFLLISDFYTRRNAAYGYTDNRINFMLKSMLDIHKINWL